MYGGPGASKPQHEASFLRLSGEEQIPEDLLRSRVSYLARLGSQYPAAEKTEEVDFLHRWGVVYCRMRHVPIRAQGTSGGKSHPL